MRRLLILLIGILALMPMLACGEAPKQGDTGAAATQQTLTATWTAIEAMPQVVSKDARIVLKKGDVTVTVKDTSSKEAASYTAKVGETTVTPCDLTKTQFSPCEVTDGIYPNILTGFGGVRLMLRHDPGWVVIEGQDP